MPTSPVISPARPPSPPLPPLPPLHRPPLLSDLNATPSTPSTPSPLSSRTSSNDSGQSLSSVLSTPSDSTSSTHTTRSGRSPRSSRPPPSAFFRRYSAQPSALFRSGAKDTRLELLNSLQVLQKEWELVPGGNVPSDPEPKRKNSRRRNKKLAAMMADPMRPPPPPPKKSGFIRRLTQSRRDEQSAPPPVAPQGPPQIPRLSTFLADKDLPLLAHASAGGSSTQQRSGSYMSSPPRNPSTSSGPAPQLPPGAAPATSTVNSPNWQQNSSSSFAVSSRPQRSVPLHVPSPMPNGTRGPRPLPNGPPMSPPSAQQALPNGAGPNSMPQPFGRNQAPPAFDQRSPPPPQRFSPQPSPPQPPSGLQHLPQPRPSPVAALASPPVSPHDPRWMPQDPRGGFPAQVYSRPPLLDVDGNGQVPPQQRTPAKPPAQQWNQAGRPLPQPQGQQQPQQQQAGYASPGHLQPGQVIDKPPMQAPPPQNHPLPSLPVGAMAPQAFSQAGPPHTRGFSNGPPNGPNRALSPTGPNRAFSPPGPNGPPNGSRALSPNGPAPGARPMPVPPGQQRPFSPNGPLPNLPPGSYGPGGPTQRRTSNPQRFMQQPQRPAPPPPGGAEPVLQPPTRSTSVHRMSSRPLPSGPAPPMPNVHGPTATASGTTMEVIASSENRNSINSRPRIAIPVPSTQATSPPPAPQPYTAPVLAAAAAATTPIEAKPPRSHEKIKSPIDINFQSSPDITALVDPRTSDSSDSPRSNRGPVDPYAQYSNLGNGHPASTVSAGNLPPRTRSVSAAARRIASSPLASPVFSAGPSAARGPEAHARAVSGGSQLAHSQFSSAGGASGSPANRTSRPDKRVSVMNRPRPKMRSNERTFTFLLTQPRVVNSLLPYLSINSFLNVLGSDDEVRKYISGEMVGRWVMREWGISVDRERGRSWPGLTVWEGFLESLLHDPAVYSTYPDQYFNLLRHLSLSHSLIVLFLRTLPPSAFPYAPPLPFEDDLQLPPLHKSSSVGSFNSNMAGGPRRPGSRATSHAGSENGSAIGIGKMPRRERVTELVMPAPLSAGPQEAPKLPTQSLNSLAKSGRRGSIGSLASVSGASFGLGRKRSNSTTAVSQAAFLAPTSSSVPASPLPQGKAGLPPVSFPAAKRYQFARFGNGGSSNKDNGNGQTSSRPGSIMSAMSSAPGHGSALGHGSLRGLTSSMSADTLPVPPPIGGGRRGARSSMGSTSSYRSERGGSASPVPTRWASPTNGLRNNETEPAFDRPPPYMTGRAPILRVFVPISDKVHRWPSAEGAAVSWRELEKCGASKRMRLGDLVVNTALARPVNTEHVLVYVPFVAHKLVPLEYVHSVTGHLPHYLDAFALSPVFYDPFLPTPQIVYLDFAPYAQTAMNSLRLAYDWHEVTTTSGARLSSKRYLHVAGLEIKHGDKVAPDWHGMISLEAEGTAEGKRDMLMRFGYGDPSRAVMGAWEVVRERSMMGSLWLRLVREPKDRVEVE